MAELLLAAIRLHEFLPGERLPSERELCARLGVNRTAVREGLRWLEQQKFIEVRRGKYGGAFVLHAPVDLAVERLRGKISDLRQLFEYREVIEPVAAALAAERIEAPELDRLQALHQRERGELGLTRAQMRAIDVEIHEIIAAASRNQYIFQAVHDIRLRLAPGLDVIGRSLTRRRESQVGHAELLAALERHDGKAAAVAMERHVAATRRAITAALAERGIDLDAGDGPPGATPERLPTIAPSPSRSHAG
ncbi:MAG TPA: FCD domain-containing protein [Candidatus Dormibacteraeota bacterium]|nr:FCD domain-containing protein [Candidatus Dormibacteraeota bacterium]